SRGITSSRKIAQACRENIIFIALSADSQPHRTSQDRQLMGRHIYSKRLGTVEPVFGNLESNKGLKRFTLRGKEKVNA
ncbi:MAG: transposase, partial [Neptunomonas phycophila]|uniref:transposase n=1 Tax=Neptunomonas phycophila TaxID=1572645 RepID=UPI003B8C475B